MKCIPIVALVLLAPTAPESAPPPLMKVLIAPGPMDEAVNKGDVRITITVPALDAPAAAPL